MPLAQLLSPAELATRLATAEPIVIDCRFALEDPAYGARVYAEGHIPGARFIDLERDLSAPVQRGITGRHPLPDPQQLLERLRALGISQHSEIVLYDDGPGAFAARAWWLLAWLGKREGVFLLDGGLNAWRAANLPLDSVTPTVSPGDLQGTPDASLLVSADTLLKRLGTPQLTLLDARALPRFRGEMEPIDPVAGHIPGAQCAVFTDNLDADGRFLPAEQLRARFDALRGTRPVESLVAYCGSGVTACHTLLVLEQTGLPAGRLYPGSWSQYAGAAHLPVATGE